MLPPRKHGLRNPDQHEQRQRDLLDYLVNLTFISQQLSVFHQ